MTLIKWIKEFKKCLKSTKKLKENLFILLTFTIIIGSLGAIVEIFPLFIKETTIEKVEGMRRHTPP